MRCWALGQRFNRHRPHVSQDSFQGYNWSELQSPSIAVIGNESDISAKPIRGGHYKNTTEIKIMKTRHEIHNNKLNTCRLDIYILYSVSKENNHISRMARQDSRVTWSHQHQVVDDNQFANCGFETGYKSDGVKTLYTRTRGLYYW